MRKGKEEFVFEELEKIDMPNRYTRRTMTITSGGELSVNKKFFEELVGEDRELKIDLRHNAQYNVLAFKLKENGNFIIPSNGKIKHRELYGTVRSFGYEIPARYIFEKDSKTDTWIGYLEEVASAPEVGNKDGRKTGTRRRS